MLLLACTPGTHSPNIVFFLTDDQRYDHLGVAGHPVLQTPNIDGLAARGVRFTNAFATTSICAASRASILTGLHERTHGYTFGTAPLRADFSALSYPSLLRQAGYGTAFIGKLGVALEADREALFDFIALLNRNPYFRQQRDGSYRHITQVAGDRAIEFLRERDRDRPFALSISFNAPHAEDSDKDDHYPWPKVMDGRYDDVVVPPPALSAPSVFDSQPSFLKRSLNRQRWFWRWDTPDKYQRNVRAYYRMIGGIDHVVGRVLDELDQQELTESTIVVFSSDNGYYLGSRGFAGKWSHYEESLRVPLIVVDPRVDASHRGRQSAAIALNIDLPATVLDLAGVAVPATYQGRSLAAMLRGDRAVDWRSDFFAEHLMHAPIRIPKWEGVRGERFVYARYFEQTPVFEFLHDLEADPDQLQNLATDPAHGDALQRMRRRTDELRSIYARARPPRSRSGDR